MKKILFLLLFSITAAAAFSQGVKKSITKNPGTVTQKSALEKPAAVLDSITVKYYDRKDTAKVILFVLVEDGTITWQKGFAVTITRVMQYGNPVKMQEMFYDQKGILMKPDDLMPTYKLYNWKK